jgi:hypothetical protein
MERIPLGGGSYLEADEAPRNTGHHKRIMRTARVPGTLSGHYADLECGHRVMMFGNLEYAQGIVLCTQCRDADV